MVVVDCKRLNIDLGETHTFQSLEQYIFIYFISGKAGISLDGKNFEIKGKDVALILPKKQAVLTTHDEAVEV